MSSNPQQLNQLFLKTLLLSDYLLDHFQRICEIMLHELLWALLGYTGDLIIDGREYNESLRASLSPEAPLAEEPTFKLAPDISFIQPSDKEVIKTIITIGFYYGELERFAGKKSK